MTPIQRAIRGAIGWKEEWHWASTWANATNEEHDMLHAHLSLDRYLACLKAIEEEGYPETANFLRNWRY